ncbi:transposase [Mesorhizobium sp. SOD10]|nr:transposase [Mesorhizobium sp. SOD10]
MTVSAPTYKNHRYPIEIVARAVWLYFRCNLSLRDVEERLLDRGIVVSYETICRWCRKQGPPDRRLGRKNLCLAEYALPCSGTRRWPPPPSVKPPIR